MDINHFITAKSTLAKSLAAAIIVLAALLIPLLLSPEGFWDTFIFNYKTIAFLLLYGVFILGVVLLVFDIHGFNITSVETDNKINHYRNIVRLWLNKYWWIIALLYISGSAISIWLAFKNV